MESKQKIINPVLIGFVGIGLLISIVIVFLFFNSEDAQYEELHPVSEISIPEDLRNSIADAMKKEFGYINTTFSYGEGLYYLKTNDSKTAASLALFCLKKHENSRFDCIFINTSNKRMSKSDWYGKSADEMGWNEILIYPKKRKFISRDFNINYNFGNIPDKLE